VFVNITWHCQNTCPYCWHRVTDDGLQVANGYIPIGPDRTEDEWVSALNSLSPACFDFVGGEPFVKDMAAICGNLADKHRYAITTNLQSERVEKLAATVDPRNCVMITGSYHPHSGFSATRMADKLLLLRQAGFPVSVNIVNHPSVTAPHDVQRFFADHSIRANISPYEECHDLYIHRKKTVLFCNGGLCNYAINNNGDAYRCLTWFRFLAGYPKHGGPSDTKYASLFHKNTLGNIFDGTFAKYRSRKRCTIFCEWKHVVDPTNSMVSDLDIRTLREECRQVLRRLFGTGTPRKK
jgi:hypothetical protein